MPKPKHYCVICGREIRATIPGRAPSQVCSLACRRERDRRRIATDREARRLGDRLRERYPHGRPRRFTRDESAEIHRIAAAKFPDVADGRPLPLADPDNTATAGVRFVYDHRDFAANFGPDELDVADYGPVDDLPMVDVAYTGKGGRIREIRPREHPDQADAWLDDHDA